MKTCSNCGAQFDDSIKFCGKCGTPLENIITDDFEKTVAAEGIYNQNNFVSETAVETPTPIYETEVKTKKPRKKMKKGLRITLLVSIIVIAVTLTVGFLTDWFGLTAPVPKIVKAAAKTFNADSFTVMVTEKYSYTYDGETETDTYKNELKVVANDSDKKLTMLVDLDDGKGLYKDGIFYSYSDDWAEIEERDIDKDFFKIRDKIGNGKKIDYEGIIKEFDFDEYLEADEAETFVKEAMKEFFTNKKWMKNTMSYKKQGKEMTFSPDFAKICEDFAAFIDDSDIIKDEDNKDAVVDALYEEAEYYEDDDMDVDISVTLKRGYLETVEIKITYDDGDYELMKFEFYDINKTEIEDKDIRRIKNKVNDLLEENGCADCGEWAYGDNELDGERYCYDCYEERTTCENCGSADYEWEYDGQNLCYDCYQDAKYTNDNYGRCNICEEYKLCNEDNICYFCNSLNIGHCKECDQYGERSASDLCRECDYRYLN